MESYFPRHWHVGLIIVVLAMAFGVQLAFPESTLANNSSFRGREVTISNYGTSATMGTTSPSV